MSEARRLRRYRVSEHDLVKLLNAWNQTPERMASRIAFDLPPTAEIVSVDANEGSRTFDVTVSDDSFALVAAGGVAPLAGSLLMFGWHLFKLVKPEDNKRSHDGQSETDF